MISADRATPGAVRRGQHAYFTDLAHQTPDGNRLLAEAIYAEFAKITR